MTDPRDCDTEYALYLPRERKYLIDALRRPVVFADYPAARRKAERVTHERGVPVEVHSRLRFAPSEWTKDEGGETE